jgi:transmembrane E3 ubiquitin-protein ligase
LLNKTLSSTIFEQESSTSTSLIYPWTSSPNHPSDVLFPTPRCEYVVYLQQDPLELTAGGISLPTVKLIEDELRFPTGAPVPSAPHMAMSMILLSPDCGFVLESIGPPEFASPSGNHLRGPKMESYLWLAKRFSSLFAAICGLQILLLIRQMNEAATPSTVSRISFYTIAIMAMGDGFVLMGFLTVGIYIDAAFLTLFSTAFIAFLSVCVFGMRFLIAIWRVQAPERRERERSANGVPGQARQTPTAVTTATGTLPLPATARANSATPVILPPDQDLGAAEAEDNATTQNTNQGTTTNPRSAVSTLYSRFYFILLGLIFLSLHATSWPQTPRSIYANVLAFVYLSFWIPQIYRNVMRNCRKALRWDFVIGQSILRLVPIVYVYSVPNNVMYIETDRRVAVALAAWVWVQIWALVSQEVLGPRFVVPNGWAPPAYDYHPILREDDLESGTAMPIGFTQVEEDASKSSSEVIATGATTRTRGKRWDCAICMQDIEVHMVPSGAGNGNEIVSSASAGLGSGILGRRSYMVTPCRHIFHSECLEGWMRVRLQCPICRETLPPL